MSDLEMKTIKRLNAALIILGGLLAMIALATFSGEVYEILFNLQADPVPISQSLSVACWSAIGAVSLGLVGGLLAIVRRGRHLRDTFAHLEHGR